MSELSNGAPSRWEALATIAQNLRFQGGGDISLSDLPVPVQLLAPDLAAAGALIIEDGRVRFFHDSLFDFVLARWWSESSLDLATSVLQTEQDLSARSVVRQVLEYQRGTDRQRYLQSLVSLLSEPDIRVHVRDVALSVLRSDPTPDNETWAKVRELFEAEDPLTQTYFVDILQQQRWFELADRNGEILTWSVGSSGRLNQATAHALANFQHLNPERAIRILAAILPCKAAHDLVVRVLMSANVDSSTGYFSVLSEAIGLGVFDDGEMFFSDMFLFPLEGRDRLPNRRDYQVLGGLVRRWTELALRAGARLDSVFYRDHNASAYLEACAKHSPTRFVDAVLKPLSEYIFKLQQKGAGRFDSDPWALLYVNTVHDVSDVLYWMITSSLRDGARMSSSKVKTWKASLKPILSTNTGKAWLYAAWTGNPEAFADDATKHLISHPDAFQCGYADSPYWITRELVAAIHPVASAQARRMLEDAILSYYPEWERSKEGRRGYGNAQYTLLDGLIPRNMSVSSRSRLEEWRRKFQYEPVAPSGVEAGFVPSPIPPERTKLMTDAQWLRAIATYSSDERIDWTKGGAHELARTLEAATRDDPARFAKLALKLPQNVNEAYPSAILMALGDAANGDNSDDVFRAVAAIFALPGHPCGRWIGRPLARLADLQIPDALLEIVNWYALNATDPVSESWKPTSGHPGILYDGDPFMAGMNSVRGAVADAVSALVWPHAERVSVFKTALDSLVSDPVSAVRAMAALAVMSVQRHDFNHALRLFRRLIDHDEVAFLATRPVEQAAIHFAQRANSGVHSMIRRMLTSAEKKVQESGGRQALFLDLRYGRGRPLLKLADDSPPARKGMAQIAAANVAYEPWTKRCQELLLGFFVDESVEVRQAASLWIQTDAAIDRCGPDFLTSFIESTAFTDHPSGLLRALEETSWISGSVIMTAVKVVLTQRLEGVSDMRTALSADVLLISTLLMRAYASAPDIQTRREALDLIDLMFIVPGADVRERIEALTTG